MRPFSKIYLYFFLIIFTHWQHTLLAQSLSDSAKISLLTCSSGEELYSSFGHSALRVRDSLKGTDWVFNYGVFDFGTPNFYLKFARGKLKYKLAIGSFERFKSTYIRENRSIYEQNLNLSQLEKQKIFDFLQENYKPENRYYLYDFFFDNCATRLRDILPQTFGDRIKFNTPENYDSNKTFRDLIDEYLQESPWSKLGIDLALGAVIDRKASFEEAMFLPDYLAEGFELAKLQKTNDISLISEDQVIYQASEVVNTSKKVPHPLIIFGVFFILILGITWWQRENMKFLNVIDVFLFFLIGLVGVIVLLLWFATDHQATVMNLNLLWAIPTHLLAIFFILKKSNLGKYYFLIVTLLQAVLLLTWFINPQDLNEAFFPITLLMGLRSYHQFTLSQRQLSLKR